MGSNFDEDPLLQQFNPSSSVIDGSFDELRKFSSSSSNESKNAEEKAINVEERIAIKQIDAELNRLRNKKRNLTSKNVKCYQKLSDISLADLEWIVQSRLRAGRGSSDYSVLSNSSLAKYYSDQKTFSHSYKLIEKLLMSNGTVDTYKVLCLHLLTMSPVNSESSLAKTARRNKIWTSENNRQRPVLPKYIMIPKAVCHCPGSCSCNDSLIQVRTTLRANSLIEMIVNCVVDVLYCYNGLKLQTFLSLIHNPKILSEIVLTQQFMDHVKILMEAGIIDKSYYSRTEVVTVLGPDNIKQVISQRKKGLVLKITLPHHNPFFQIPAFNVKTSAGSLFGDHDESVPVLLSLYKQVTLGKKVNDELSGLSILPDFSNTRLTVVADDGTDFAAIGKSGNIMKPKSVKLAQDLQKLVKNTIKENQGRKPGAIQDLLEEDSAIGGISGKHHQHQFSRNPAVFVESLISIAREKLGLLEKTGEIKKGISEMERRKMESELLRCSILRRLSNAERILLIQEAARKTQNHREMLRKMDHSNIEIFSSLMTSVLSKRSLMALARNSSKKEREFMFRPISKGGLGFGELILQDGTLSEISSNQLMRIQSSKGANLSVSSYPDPQLMELTREQIMNEVSAAEIKERITRFSFDEIQFKPSNKDINNSE